MSRGSGKVQVTGWGQQVWVERDVLRYWTEDGWKVTATDDD